MPGKTAVAIWNGWVSPVFDVSRMLLVFAVENKRVLDKKHIVLKNDDLEYKIALLQHHRVENLICGAVSRPLADRLRDSGIHLISFVAGNADRVIQAYLAGELPCEEMSMPGRRRCNRFNRRNAHYNHYNEKEIVMPKGRGGGRGGGGGGRAGGKGAGTGGGRGNKGGKGQGGRAGRRSDKQVDKAKEEQAPSE